MVYKVIWSPVAIETYINNVKYLETEWTETEVKKFIDAVKRKVHLLSSNPNLGVVTNKRKNVRKSVIHRRVILFYRSKSTTKEIELIRFWGTPQNPQRLKF